MKPKRIAAVLTALALILGALPSAGLAVRAEGPRNEPGVEAESRPINEARPDDKAGPGDAAGPEDETNDPIPYLDPLSGSIESRSDYVVYSGETTLADGVWYAMTADRTVNDRLIVNGTVHLILGDGVTLTVPEGVTVSYYGSLTVWAQSDAQAPGSAAGRLFAGTTDGTDATCPDNFAGIGGGYGYMGYSGDVTVNGGAVTAVGRRGGAGIGGCCSGRDGTAGGSFTVNGGTVNATGGADGSAGIGGGCGSDFGGRGGTVTINGGAVTATGGIFGGAGIGGGRKGAGGSVTVNGGTVTAVSGQNAQAIGHGRQEKESGTLAIPGMRVFAAETDTGPVPAAGREDTCRGSWARLELCQPHHFHIEADLDHCCDFCGTVIPGDQCPGGAFTDMPPATHYAHVPIDWAIVNHITEGTSPTTFSPKQTVTRAQMVTFLWAANGRPEPESAENPFADVSDSAWYYKAVLWAVENGITSGVTPTTFGPKQVCNRAQVVTFLWAAEGKPEPEAAENPFTDVSETAWYYKAVLWAYENGVTGGTTATTFSPKTNCTRAQVVTFLYKVYGT